MLHPDQVVAQLHVGNGMQVADFGCGHGYLSIPLAQAASHGTVYCFDVVEEELNALRSHARLKGVRNIKDIRANLEAPDGSKLADDSIDLVMMANILFQSQLKAKIIEEAVRVLKPGGRLVIIDWIIGASLAPEGGWLLSSEEAVTLAEAAGLTLGKELKMDEQHFGLVFKKKSAQN